jgi:hypothetical protein
MPYASTPFVRRKLLHDRDVRIPLDSPAWFAWLQTANRFAYCSHQEHVQMTVRKEKRRHTFYWFAYTKWVGKLHNSYIGRSDTLTQARLEQVVVQLHERARRALRPTAKVTPAPTQGGDGMD